MNKMRIGLRLYILVLTILVAIAQIGIVYLYTKSDNIHISHRHAMQTKNTLTSNSIAVPVLQKPTCKESQTADSKTTVTNHIPADILQQMSHTICLKFNNTQKDSHE